MDTCDYTLHHNSSSFTWIARKIVRSRFEKLAKWLAIKLKAHRIKQKIHFIYFIRLFLSKMGSQIDSGQSLSITWKTKTQKSNETNSVRQRRCVFVCEEKSDSQQEIQMQKNLFINNESDGIFIEKIIIEKEEKAKLLFGSLLYHNRMHVVSPLIRWQQMSNKRRKTDLKVLVDWMTWIELNRPKLLNERNSNDERQQQNRTEKSNANDDSHNTAVEANNEVETDVELKELKKNVETKT